VDLDAHFGDGTALLFARDRDCLAVSLHWAQHAAEEGDPRFFPFLQGAPDERMEDGTAPESTVSLPLPTGAGDADALAALAGAAERVRAFAPELVVVACGFDGLATDPTSGLALTPQGYGALVERVLEMCGADVPCVCVLEGGYDPRGVAESFEAVVRALDGGGEGEARGASGSSGTPRRRARRPRRRRCDGRGDDPVAAEADGGARKRVRAESPTK
jgi:acetoin utilization deacetylase AcuC-like enzyme